MEFFFAIGSIQPRGFYVTLVKPLDQAVKEYDKSHVTFAIHMLYNFIYKVEIFSGQSVAPKSALILITDALWLIEQIQETCKLGLFETECPVIRAPCYIC